MPNFVAKLKMSDGLWKGLIEGPAEPGHEAITYSLVAASSLDGLLVRQEAEVKGSVVLYCKLWNKGET